MKKRTTTYTFDASAQTIDAADFTSLEAIQLITNVTDGIIIYNFADPAKGGTLAGTVLTLDYDTTAMADADKLQILIEDGTTTQAVSGTVTANAGTGTLAVSAASLPLPSGAATSAKQDTIAGHLDGVEGLLTDIEADTDTLAIVGGGVEAAALRVTIANDSTGVVSVDDNGGSLTVDGTVAVTNAGLTELAAAINSDKVDVNIASGNISGFATSAKQDTGNTSLASIDGKITAVNTGAVVISSGSVTADTELTTADLDTGAGTDTRAVVGLVGSKSGGAALIPGDATAGLKVDLGTDNDVTVTGSVTANAGTNLNTSALALAATQTDKSQFTKLTDGTDTALITASGEQNVIATAQPGVDIGDVTINNASGASAVNIQDGGNSITVDGTVTASNVSGDVAGAATDSGNPVKVGGVYNSAPPTYTAGQRADLQLGSRGSVKVSLMAADSTSALVVGGSDADTIAGVAGNILRTGALNYLYNGSNWDRARGDTTNGLDVDVTRSALPTGASTLAEQQSQTTALQLIDDTVFADDAAVTLGTSKGNVAAGVAVQTDGTDPTVVSAEGDAAALRTDMQRNLIVNQTHPRFWHASADYASAQTNASVKAAPGASLSLYITDFSISNGATAGNITLLDGSGGTVLYELYPAINGGATLSLRSPIKLTANTALCITSTTVTTHAVFVSGYIGP